jgi:hypothetical protein
MLGKFPTGSDVTIIIYDLSNNNVIVNNEPVNEILATGYFKYLLEGITEPKEFLYIMTDGLTNQSGKLIFREDLIAFVEMANLEEVWTTLEKQQNLAYSRKASDNAEQINYKITPV